MPLAFPKPGTAIRPASSLLEQIGNTPLLRLAKLDAEFPDVEIYAKAEFFNPGGSVKDRAGLNMILDGERTGRLTKDRRVVAAWREHERFDRLLTIAEARRQAHAHLPGAQVRQHLLWRYSIRWQRGVDGGVRY